MGNLIEGGRGNIAKLEMSIPGLVKTSYTPREKLVAESSLILQKAYGCSDSHNIAYVVLDYIDKMDGNQNGKVGKYFVNEFIKGLGSKDSDYTRNDFIEFLKGVVAQEEQLEASSQSSINPNETYDPQLKDDCKQIISRLMETEAIVEKKSSLGESAPLLYEERIKKFPFQE